jgi:biotin carboxylase
VAGNPVNKRKILVLGGGIDSLEILRRLKEMGLHTTVFDKNPDAPAKQHLTDVCVNLSCYDAWPILSWLVEQGENYAGVLCAGVDAPTVMAVLSHSPYVKVGRPKLRVAELSQSKWAQKVLFIKAGIRVPAWPAPGEKIAANIRIVKPVSQRGSRGIMRVLPGEPLAPALTYAREADPKGQVLVEDWVDGVQLSSESIVQEGKILFTAFSQRNYSRLAETHPYVIEDGGDMPPMIEHIYENDYARKAKHVLQACVHALGMGFGTLKGDLVWDGQDIWVIEVAVRLSGGNFCSVQIPKVWGVDFVGCAAKIAMGEYIYKGEIRPYLRNYMSQRFIIPLGITSHPERGKGFIGFGGSREQATRRVSRQINDWRQAHD